MKWNIFNKLSGNDNEKIIKLLLANRGLKTKKEIEEFLNPEKPSNFTAKDLGIDIKEVNKAVKRIHEAIKSNEAIIVYGDYDADGICATAILWETLYQLTKNVLPYIPERVSEGYGLNCDSIKKLKTSAFAKATADKQNSELGLIITVDHGITANDKIKFAKELGIDVIVCDHHQPPKKKPQCAALVYTERVCAAAIAWFLAEELQRSKVSCLPAGEAKQQSNYLDLVAIATIADLEPLVGINRSLVKYGLGALNQTKRCGLLAIFEEAGIKSGEIGTYEVGYIIAPRLNAMGRMEHALESLRLVCTPKKEQAKDLATKLGLKNKERQLLTLETTKHAIENSKLKTQNSKLIFIEHETYNQGIIGLVAGKLVEEFHRPAIVIAKGEVYSKASARSISGFNIIEAIRAQSNLLVDAGGHPLAAGFTIETVKIETLRQKLLAAAEEQISTAMLEKTLRVDLILPLEAVTLKLWQEIQKMAPFGLGNPEPVFGSQGMIKDFRVVGSGKHLKLTIGNFSAIAFNQASLIDQLKFGQEVEFAYNLSLNQWNGEQKLELKVKDVRWPVSKS